MDTLSYGRWKTVEVLGRGGNATVWLAVDPAGNEAALKVLDNKKIGSERYKRFRDEIRAASQSEGVPGILPVIESSLPQEPSREHRAWLAMPVAELLRVHLGDNASVGDVVTIFVPIAETLSDLSTRDIYHRDIKPDNLYWYEGAPAVGDFGLVTFPGKEPVTAPARKLGPLHFMAPEMVAGANEAAPGPADVWSLAKTMWVLATGQRHPLPGPHRLDEEAFSISAYSAHPRAYLLDELLMRCTRLAPSERPLMPQLRDELRAWLQPRRDARSVDDVRDLGKQIELMRQARAKKSAEKNWAPHAMTKFSEMFMEALRPIAEKLREAGFQPGNGAGSDWFWSLVDAPPLDWGVPKASAAYYYSIGDGFPPLTFYPCMAAEIYENRTCRLAAAYLIQNAQFGREVMFLKRVDLPLDAPAQHEQVIVAFQDHLSTHLRQAFATFVELLENQPDVNPE